MDDFTLSIITYVISFITAWVTFVLVGVIGNMVRAHSCGRHIRLSDVYQSLFLLVVSIFGITALFIHPGIMLEIPSTVMMFELGSMPILVYLSEKHLRDWGNLCILIKDCNIKIKKD